MLFWKKGKDMSKKKQLKKLAKSNIQVLKTGKIKIAKGEKISLKSFVNESIKNTVISRLDGIISQEDVVIDTKDLRVDITSNMTTDFKTSELISRVQSPKTNTIVVTVNKKNALDVFDFLDDSSLGIIPRNSPKFIIRFLSVSQSVAFPSRIRFFSMAFSINSFF